MTKILFNNLKEKENQTIKENQTGQTNNKMGSLQISSLSWFQALSPKLQELLVAGSTPLLSEIEEIRLRIKRPLLLRVGARELSITQDGQITEAIEDGELITKEDLERTVQILSQNSLYAWDEEFRNGYITIPGGHRIGIVGRAVLENGQLKTLKDISGINYRIGRQILGCANAVLPFLIKQNQQVCHTLIISPPQCGKTTLLRDIVRQLSNGIPALHFSGVNVGLVDERSEIAGMYQGEPQFQIGQRTDVLDACPKAQGMMMLIRSMSPRVLATDEVGKNEDLEAMYQALQAGVTVITTVHGNSMEEIKERPNLQALLNWRFFDRMLILSRRQGVGTLEKVLDGKTLERMS